MSEHSVTVVRLDRTSPTEREKIVLGVQDLLLAQQVIAPNDRRDASWQPSSWKAGPAARTAVAEPVDWFDAFLDTANNGVDIDGERHVHHPVENDEAPRCPECAAEAPTVYTDTYGDWLEQWWTAGDEPLFTCDQCGWTGPIGDWCSEFSVLIGAPAVTFFNWPPLSPTLITAIRETLGGGTGSVVSHW
ncbi:hypothetical protein EV382_0119 [Micromonospora violae]|uniref:Uncharacterized protein n=1 Tax=Micromonospora violae TaxID=1278207 RepID=A0A4Q7U7V0_9ACTN|nr:hypothetical protein [Micromonospora violae]RZT76987.1 hypothetical protein EV382_0119 [Micromonospora violae]